MILVPAKIHASISAFFPTAALSQKDHIKLYSRQKLEHCELTSAVKDNIGRLRHLHEALGYVRRRLTAEAY